MFMNPAKMLLKAGSLVGFVLLLGVLALVAHVATHTAVVDPRQTGPADFFAEAPSNDLALQGITLSDPGTLIFTPLGQSSTEQTATRLFSGTVLHSALVHFHFSRSKPELDCICWAVSIQPPGGVDLAEGGQKLTASGVVPASNSLQPVRYLIVFVDASTGRFIFATERGPGVIPSR